MNIKFLEKMFNVFILVLIVYILINSEILSETISYGPAFAIGCVCGYAVIKALKKIGE